MKKLTLATCCLALCWQVFLVASAAGQSAVAEPKDSTKVPEPIQQSRLSQLQKQRQSLDAVLQRLRDTLGRDTAIELELQEKIQKLEKTASRIKMNSSSNEDVERLLMTRRVELVVGIAGLEARQTATLKMQTDAEKKLDESANEEIELIERLVQFAEIKSNNTKKMADRGSAAQNEVMKAEQDVTEAKLRLLERKNRSARANANGDSLEPTSLELAEKKAELEIVDKLLEDTVMAKSTLNELAEVKSRLEHLKTARIKGQSELLQDVEKVFLQLDTSIFELENEGETSEDK